MEEATGERDPLLDSVRIPSAAEYLWEWFWELSNARRTGIGLDPITFSDIHDWATLCDTRPQPWEVRALRAMDQALREAVTNAD